MFTQLSTNNVRHLARVGVVILLLVLVAGATTNTSYAVSPRPQVSGEAETPFQSALAEALAQRQAAGLPVPTSVTYDVQREEGMQGGFGIQSMGARSVSVIGSTTIEFANPQQAGYDEWPALVVKDDLPEEFSGKLAAGDYTELYREEIDKQFPGFWDTYEFGQEPRRYTITETMNITYPPEMMGGASMMATNVMTAEDILMGFTYAGPHIDYAIGDEWEICFLGICGKVYEFKAGFELDWGLGLRLPAHVNLTGPAEMVQGSPYDFTTSLTPLDWSAAQYLAAGVEPENGNEFVLRMYFFAGVKGEIVGIDLCPSCYAELDFDESESFTTPFGSDAEFPIPTATIPIYEIDLAAMYFGLGLEIDPHLTSTMITADWAGLPGTDCSGAGSLTYTAPDTLVAFGPVTACNYGPSNLAEVHLNNFRYWFNEFLIELTAYMDFEVFDYGVWHPTIDIASIDLSDISDGLSLGGHVQCDPLFHCSDTGPGNDLFLSIPVWDETPPATNLMAWGTQGTHGWYTSDVTISLSAVDGPPGCGTGVLYTEYSLDGTTWNTYQVPFVLTTEGANTVYYRSIDYEGNVEATQSRIISIDKTPPVITGAPTTPANSYGWYNTDVVVHFDATDTVSGVYWMTPDQMLSAEAANQSVSGTAIDMAGNSAIYTVTGINIDKTAPTVTITSPAATTYNNTDSFNIGWGVTDGLSGVASEGGTLDGSPVSNGQMINLLIVAAGPHTVTVTGVDQAGNLGSASVTFQVHVDPDGLLASLEYMCAQGWIDAGQCNSLRAKLLAALADIDRGRLNAAENTLNAFVRELEAQVGKHLTQQAFDVLKAGAEYVIANL